MRKTFLIALISATFFACNNSTEPAAASRTTDSTAAAPTWISLFDGKTLNGWHSYGRPAAGKAWQVTDSSIHLQPYGHAGYQVEGGGDLVTDSLFSDFDLQLQWKIARKGNSGIIFYVQEDTSKYKETWNTGPEMQVLDINGGGDSHSFKRDIGELYDLVPATLHPARPALEWNKAEIISSNSQLKLYLNDTLIITTRLWDDAWKKLIAGSKFRDMPGFGTFRQGHIALQDHGDEIWFKDLRIRRL